jgi:hypothetical protein
LDAAVLLFLLSVAAAGCGGDDGTGFDHYFATKPYKNAACNDADARLALRREVHLFTHDRNTDVPPFSRALQRYYRRHGLAFFSNQEVTETEQTYALDTDPVGLREVLTREFPGVNLDDEAALKSDPVLYQRIAKSTMNFMFRPLIEFARTHSVAADVTNLVILPQILRPNTVGFTGGDVLGLAISPTLLRVFAGQDLPEAAAWQVLDLPQEFTPMMFLDGRLLGRLLSGAPDLVDLVAAHEFGHTGGLVHRTEEHNLMLPAVQLGVSACSDSLDDDQITTMQMTFGLAGKPTTRQAARRIDPGEATPGLHALLPPDQLPALLRGDPDALARLVKHFAN